MTLTIMMAIVIIIIIAILMMMMLMMMIITKIVIIINAISARRPDIVIIYKLSQPTTLIDVEEAQDWKVKEKEDEMNLKYQDLKIEIKNQWNIKAKVILITVGSVDAISMNIEKPFVDIPGKHNSTALINQLY